MDIFLLIATILVAVIIVAVNTYLLAIYIHPDDRGFGASLFPKILVVFGLTLSWGMVLMLPLDVANSQGTGGGLNMDLFWEIVIILTAVILVILIPFAYTYYETDETKTFRRRLGVAILYTLLTIIGFGVAFFVTYLLFNDASIPIENVTITTASLTLSSSTYTAPTIAPTIVDTTIELDVSITVYTMAFFSFIGWILVVFFGGMGLFSVPMDLINAYRNKPMKRNKKDLDQCKADLQLKLEGLIHMGQEIEITQRDAESTRGFLAKRSAVAKVNKTVNKFKASILTLEEEFEKYAQEVNYVRINPLVYKFKLVLGIFFFLVSTLWWIHTLLSSIAVSTFLSDLFNKLEDQLSLGFIASILFSCLAVYLLVVVTKGNVKFGLNIPFLFTIHPMKANETLMNSFLFNVWMILTAAIGVVQFLTTTFAQYTRLTSAQFYFDTQVKYMTFFNWFFNHNVFEYAFLAWSILTLVWLWCCEGRKARMQKRAAKNLLAKKQNKIEMQTKR